MSRTTYRLKIISWAAVVLWMGLIFYLSHQPATVSNELSTGVMAQFLNFIEVFLPFKEWDPGTLHHIIRKNAHFFAYFTLGILSFIAVNKSFVHSLKAGVVAFVICVLYAVSDETHQLFIPGRSGEIRDVLIDSSGAMTGIVLYLLINKLIKKFIMRRR